MLRARLYRGKNSKAVPVEPRVEGDVLVVSDDLGIYLDDIDVQVGGQDGQRISLRSAKTGAVLLFDTDAILDDLLASGSASVIEQVNQARRKLKGKKGADMRYWSTVFGVCLGVVVAGALAFNAFIAWVPSHLDKKVEKYIGESASDGVPCDTNKAYYARVKRVGQRLIAGAGNLPYDFVFRVKKDDSVNACAYPGGFMFVNRGLLKAVKDDNELAGVMGHEMGHVICHHSCTAMVRNLGMGGVVALFGAVCGDMDKLAVLVSAAQTLEQYRFSRGQESEADMVGLKLAMDADYDPHGLIHFFERMEKEHGPENQMLKVISDHPLDAERVEAAQKEIERLTADKLKAGKQTNTGAIQ